MSKRAAHLQIDREDLRIAKGIAAFKGMSIKDYFSQMVDREAKEFHLQMRDPIPVYRRRKL